MLTRTLIATGLALACSTLVALSQQKEKPAEKPQASFSYAGTVTNAQGEPVAGVEVTATHHDPDENSYGYIETVETNATGEFSIDRERAISGAPAEALAGRLIRLEFHHPQYAFAQLEDVSILSRELATNLAITLRDGRSLKGRIVDAKGQGVAAALVEIKFGEQYKLRRATTSDAKGHFQLHGLPNLAGELHVLTIEPSQPLLSASQPIEVMQHDVGDIMAAEIKLPEGTAVHELFGMKLIDVDADVQKKFHLHDAQGVVILDPGKDSERLKIGKLQRGDHFWIVSDQPVKNFEEFKKRILASARAAKEKSYVRVVYRLKRVNFSGTNTQHFQLSEADVVELSR